MQPNSVPFLQPLNNARSSIILLDSDESIIGRDPSCDVVLGSDVAAGVSRQHLAVKRMPGQNQFVLNDLGSSNGTYINGQRVQREQPLKSGDRIRLGANGPEFEFVDPASAPATVIEPQQPQNAAPQTVIGQGAIAQPINSPTKQMLTPVQSNPRSSQEPNRWGEFIKWGVGGIGLLIALKFLFGTGTPRQESAAPRSSPAPTQPAVSESPPDQTTAPQASPNPSKSDTFKPASMISCKDTQNVCTADTSSFNPSDSIKITTRFENRLEPGTVFTPRIQYSPSEGDPIEVELDKKTAPNPIDTLDLSLKPPQGGWRSGRYKFVLAVSNSSGSATISKPFSVQ